MTFSSNQSLNTNQLPISVDINPGEENYEDNLLLYVRRIANSVNTKESGLYTLQENANFEQWFGNNPQQNRNGYRITIDLVALRGSNIPVGASSVTLTANTQPPKINGYLYPVQGFGGCVDSSGRSYFPSDSNVSITYNHSTNRIFITNNTGKALVWAVWVMEYLKN